MSGKSNSDTSERELVATRIFDAPPELVFRMWTDKNHIAQWWGPRGFTTTTYDMDMKPGGVWRYVMHGPDGRDYQNKITYIEIVEPQRIVFKHGGEKDTEPVNHEVTVTFDQLGGGRTKLTMRMVFVSAAAKKFVVDNYDAARGLQQTMDRLVEQVAAKGGGEVRPFVISRVFDAPRELVWKAWTERDQLMQWFGPKGWVMNTAKLDFRPGGTFHYCMRTADGTKMWAKFTYREIDPPQRIVWVNSFSDEQGGLGRHPLAPEWPREMLSMATLTETDGKTTVTIQWAPLNASAEEIKTFDTGRESMTMGWSGTFEQLAAHLAKG